ncbi:hypothetical protein SAMN05444387_4772 [Flavobacterium pectinovorum]|uniref:Uncharacterized protein n=1 Tax=Flavobacterium pectinovorum TaxID=29533 RepID=A0ABY1JAB2_9FLAO|nr:hypothetical protein SAMN05444387_4772 [Flavobacterium pectinovorum]
MIQILNKNDFAGWDFYALIILLLMKKNTFENHFL